MQLALVQSSFKNVERLEACIHLFCSSHVSSCCVAVAGPYGQCGGSHPSGQAPHPPNSVLPVESAVASSQFTQGLCPGGIVRSCHGVVSRQHQEKHSSLFPGSCYIDDRCIFGLVGCESLCHRLVLSFNITTVSYLNKQGGGGLILLCSVA